MVEGRFCRFGNMIETFSPAKSVDLMLVKPPSSVVVKNNNLNINIAGRTVCSLYKLCP